MLSEPAFGVLWMLISISTVCCQSICPYEFLLVGRKCYLFSKDEATWQNAHFNCLMQNSTLAVVTKSQQEFLMRQFINRHGSVLGIYERWLGGIFNEKQSKWVWGSTGKSLVFHGFSRMNANDKVKWTWHCIIVDPSRQNKWSARNCVQKLRYICQTPTNKSVEVSAKTKRKHRCHNKLCSTSSNETAPGYFVHKPVKTIQSNHVENFICPSYMIVLGRKCYFFSLDQETWTDAHYACRENHTKLAIVNNKLQDTILRGFLNKDFVEKQERWIGGIFDWKQNKWKWAINGRVIKYRNFPKSVILNQQHTYHSITLDPRLGNRWNSVNRVEKRHYICQVKPKTLVKYQEPLKIRPPDATVLIQINSSNNGLTDDFKATTTATLGNYNLSHSDRYVYN